MTKQALFKALDDAKAVAVCGPKVSAAKFLGEVRFVSFEYAKRTDDGVEPDTMTIRTVNGRRSWAYMPIERRIECEDRLTAYIKKVARWLKEYEASRGLQSMREIF